jgi:hypothetical protein
MARSDAYFRKSEKPDIFALILDTRIAVELVGEFRSLAQAIYAPVKRVSGSATRQVT